VNISEFKKALNISEKNTELNCFKEIRNVFKSNDAILKCVYELNFENDKDIIQFLKKYAENFEFVEYVPKVYLCSQYTPNDFIDDPDTLWHIDHLGLREAWYLMDGITHQTKVAIIDNGYDGDHEDLIGNITYIEPAANNNQYHGTAVAGIAGMTTNNEIGYCSIAGLYSDMYLYIYNNIPAKIVSAADAECKVI
jgi:subtilisin family serine protease